MDFRSIRQTARINGENRNPGVDENGKAMVWNNQSKSFDYIAYASLLQNSKTNNGYVLNGDASAEGEYVWKLDSQKNPLWRKEQFLASAERQAEGNNLILTMSGGEIYDIPLGALAWENTLASPVTSVFGRNGVVTSQSGDYLASQITNAFDKSSDTLNEILEGTINKHFTEAYRSAVTANTAARHTHANKNILDLITNAGGGIIPTFNQISSWDNLYANHIEIVQDTVQGFLQNNTGISFTYNDESNTLTPEINLGNFTTDDLPEGLNNKYYNPSNDKNVFTIILSAGSTVAQRCAAPISLPNGWVVAPTGSGVDLLVTHNLARPVEGITVFSINGSNGHERLLLSNAAYSGLYCDGSFDRLTIEALATVPTAIRINITLI